MIPRRVLVGFVAALLLAGCGSSNSSSSSTSSNGTSSAPPASGVFASGGENHIHSIAISQTNPKVIYLAGHYRLLRSTDGGVHWHPLLSQMMISLAVDPSHPATMYGVSSTHGSMVSHDAGVHWSSTGSSLPTSKAVGVAVNPQGVVFAYGSGVYRSTDGGKRWTHALSSVSVTSIASGGNTIYVAGDNGLQVSRDGGAHWRVVSAIGPQPVLQVAASGKIAYAVTATVPLFRTRNGGRTWKPLNRAPVGLEYLGISPSDPNILIGHVSMAGFEASRDGGQTWHSANHGILDKKFTSSVVRFTPADPNVAYTGSWGIHLYRTRNAGATWARIASLPH